MEDAARHGHPADREKAGDPAQRTRDRPGTIRYFFVIILFYPFAVLLIFFSYRSYSGGVKYLKYFRDRLDSPPSDFRPFATIFAPCKGLDDGLGENLEALTRQNYPGYEIVFVVDDRDDPAAAVIEETRGKTATPTKLIVAPTAKNSGQKVENLREAVLHADERSGAFVFVDSDARPGNDWLSALISPLSDESVGVATGYRWFVPERQNLAGELLSAWNASIASALGPETSSNFCWGGSMAIRRDVFERIDMREKWSGTLSDDFAVTRAVKAAGLAIYFVPQALTASTGNCTFRGLFEFTNRQMKITRVNADKLWLLSFFGSGLFNSVMIASVLILAAYRAGTLPWLAAAFTVSAVSIFSVGKSWLRCRAVRLALPSHIVALDRQFGWQLTLWVLTPAVFLINCFAALLSNTIDWRGIEYKMVSPTETKIGGRNPE